MAKKMTKIIELNNSAVEVLGTCRGGQREFVIHGGDANYSATANIKDNKLEEKWKNDLEEEGVGSATKDAEK
jgi:hypothetical protein